MTSFLFTKILIANRGEIAVRIIRACRELGIASVAVFSDIDRNAMHVQLADESMFIGAAPADQSYLNFDKIIQAALACKAEAIHPGYGLLSENAGFARAVQQAGLVFIGPPAEAIAIMGDKSASRQAMQSAGIPIVPGYHGQDDDALLMEAAQNLGCPILVKASAGGGGKGMRLVWEPEQLPEAISAARREAKQAFGDDHLLLETYIPNAHHVEFQILADQHGNMVHLFERECSVQRRHQKIIEESPSPLLDSKLRAEMGITALKAAEAVGYTNAGTIEFIVNPGDRTYYFLEMNTRLQVEHPVTELMTGIDLVKWQILIAAGQSFKYSQAVLSQRGHAIECRIYAEEPENGFLPAAGELLCFKPPSGPGIRVDSGYDSGDEISVYYDPLIAKIIVAAEDRPGALKKMGAALSSTVILGLPTNLRFLIKLLATESFQHGKIHTAWVDEHYPTLIEEDAVIPVEVLVAAALVQEKSRHSSAGASGSRKDPYCPWEIPDHFRMGESS